MVSMYIVCKGCRRTQFHCATIRFLSRKQAWEKWNDCCARCSHPRLRAKRSITLADLDEMMAAVRKGLSHGNLPTLR